MNVKIVVVATAGTMSGRMIRKKVLKYPQPSMRAASSSSLGRPRMNCTMRNTKNASVPSNLGTIKGKNVFTQPNCWNRMYWGTRTTWYGIMIVNSMIANMMVRPVNLSRANAYAAKEHDTTLPMMQPRTTIDELSK